jgi:hypothetical protein
MTLPLTFDVIMSPSTEMFSRTTRGLVSAKPVRASNQSAGVEGAALMTVTNIREQVGGR